MSTWTILRIGRSDMHPIIAAREHKKNPGAPEPQRHRPVWGRGCGTRAGGCSLRQGITVATKTKLEESLMIATPRYADPEAIVSTAWLAEHLPDPALRIYDCTTYLHYETGTGRPYRLENGRADYEQAH